MPRQGQHSSVPIANYSLVAVSADLINVFAGDDTSQLLRVRTLVYPSQLTGGGECRSNKRVGRGRYITVVQGPHSSVPKPTHWW
jgi:hypothetical protein